MSDEQYDIVGLHDQRLVERLKFLEAHGMIAVQGHIGEIPIYVLNERGAACLIALLTMVALHVKDEASPEAKALQASAEQTRINLSSYLKSKGVPHL